MDKLREELEIEEKQIGDTIKALKLAESRSDITIIELSAIIRV